jgi:class 3 adenylate cyclase
MAVTPSPEIEAVARRIVAMWNSGNVDAMSNLFASSDLRVLGFDADERWNGLEQFLSVFGAQMSEMPDWSVEADTAEAFEDGVHGWAIVQSTLVTPETATPMRHSGVFILENGTWRVVQWHNSIPVPNQQVFGVQLTTTLEDLVSSVLDSSGLVADSDGSEGTATLVFTDIVDSTSLAHAVGDTAWAELVHRHERMIRSCAESEGGTVVKFLGDGSMLAFASARAAIRTAVQIQRAGESEPYTVRIGIHTGEVIRTDDDLLGVTVNKAARVAAAATGGVILVSSTTRELAGDMDSLRIGEPRIVVLKGLPDAHQVSPIEWDR